MNDRLDDERLKAALREVFAPAPEPDYRTWQQRYPEAMAALKSLGTQPPSSAVERRVPPADLRVRILGYRGMSLVAACVAVLMVGLAIWFQCAGDSKDVRPDPSPQENKAAVATSHPAEEPVVPVEVATSKAKRMVGMASSSRPTPLSVQLSYGSAAVRVRMQKIDAGHLECRVVCEIFGSVPQEVLHVERLPGRRFAEMAAQPTDPPRPGAPGDEADRSDPWKMYLKINRFQPGREAILLIDECREQDGVTVGQWRQTWIDSIQQPLDQLQEEIFKIIKRGQHLTPSTHPDDLLAYARRSDVIVRARLSERQEKWAQWQIAGVLFDRLHERGRPSPVEDADGKTLEHVYTHVQPWEVRAETIVRQRRAEGATPSETRSAVKNELERLLARELPIGREVILFLRVLRDLPPGKDGYPKLVGIAYADEKDPKHLEQFESAVARIVGQRQQGGWPR